MKQSDIQELHCGLHRVPLPFARRLMPSLSEAWQTFRGEHSANDYVVDVKVHMLMPGQYPCIPNWHCDMVPRDDHGELLPGDRVPEKMYLWLSNPPITEFKDGREIKLREWNSFTQFDSHRGVPADEHIWRVFIRICPNHILAPNPSHKWLRRHSQVYLDADTFQW